jgi:predicted Zn-dependent protease
MKPLVNIGWVLAADERNQKVLKAYEQARQNVLTGLSEQFPQFHWEMPLIKRRRYPRRGALDPLPLLEMGVQEKIYGAWDYALVIVPNELNPRDRTFTIGVPSSALEVAVISSASLDFDQLFSERLGALALHLLGHMWGLEHEDEGPMSPPEDYKSLGVAAFPSKQQVIVIDRLEEVADARLEEQQGHWGWLSFHWRTFWADPDGILTDIWGYKPWRLPFRMERLTAAAVVSIIFLLLSAEAWEIGINSSILPLGVGAVVSVLTATSFVFLGQNLSQISREFGRREQLTRTRIILFCTLLLGMFVLWGVLFAGSYLAVIFVPRGVSAGWLGNLPDSHELARHASFMATVGAFVAALGGNLEDEDEFKAQLLYDEET